MNKQMKRWLEGAIFIGFTGTPLLRKDKLMTRGVCGTYIHTSKFQQGVADGLILDLKAAGVGEWNSPTALFPLLTERISEKASVALPKRFRQLIAEA